jgi:hypothetical protein
MSILLIIKDIFYRIASAFGDCRRLFASTNVPIDRTFAAPDTKKRKAGVAGLSRVQG